MKEKFKIYSFKKIDSTNNYAKKLAQNGAKEKTVVIASEQTAGRGRLGRTFLSKKGGVYFSVVLRPKTDAEGLIFITVAAAVAVCHAIEKVSLKKCEIKWVNDIYINGKKVCGILTEGGFNSQGAPEFAILGVGINAFAHKNGFPENLPLADSIFKKNIPFKTKFIKKRLVKEFLKEFFNIYENIENKDFIKEYAERSFLNGKTITYKTKEKEITAKVRGIDKQARLVVESDGQERALSHGEIQIVGMEQLEI